MAAAPRSPLSGQGPALAAVAVGGAVGALARWGVGLAAVGSPWVTATINVVGCLLLGALLVITERRRAHPLVRPVLGTGVLGGFTTFSAYTVDAFALDVGLATVYVLGTLAAALAATWSGMRLARALA